eukprot:TRINITY_DN10230_c0_g1_i1.p3 TRINITY_DN10230_c0_g1~~TRINITY_DN10230_c0_g1_i1.p3  ORF type:complete len:109 (+),score=14.76 TRINITY_DN10230_c0_g1_i1:135-461(+)
MRLCLSGASAEAAGKAAARGRQRRIAGRRLRTASGLSHRFALPLLCCARCLPSVSCVRACACVHTRFHALLPGLKANRAWCQTGAAAAAAAAARGGGDGRGVACCWLL